MEERETKLQTEKEKIHEELSAKTKEIERYDFIDSKSTLHIFPTVMRIRDPQDPHFFESKDPDPQKNADPGSGSCGINFRKNLLKFIAFIADILLMKPIFKV